MDLRERRSPNHDARTGIVDMLVLHYTGMKSAAEALERLTSPDAAVSAHYLVDEDGTVWRLVAEERRAWHAGMSSWRGRSDINGASIGIELVNPGHAWGYRAFPGTQIEALVELCRAVMARQAIPQRHVLGHSDVAPTRKMDPGELFPWAFLARAGIGLWPEAPWPEAPENLAETRRLLDAIGYAVEDSGAAITAFQRRYRPLRCDGAADEETRRLIAAVAKMCGEV
ncbi:MAG TPA: N-acetylmuramoyl-L-alanine amidase [Stellaceae bacterium]|nr:N-acetylmuramoyl-L-alanine amidase [Stellaceae bacterium]